ncbi:TniQ family protein [Cohnella sp. GCM10020058]|uniref:TniQ family protein n=1 Tax=Cohnella sp. GCM10020058 TaxID=3317330 RepID=UPI0036391274
MMMIEYPYFLFEEEHIKNPLGLSKLYALQPIGLGTNMVESVSSFVSRLAAEHCLTVSNLFNLVFIPYLNNQYSGGKFKRMGEYYFDSVHTINGTSGTSNEFSSMINDLTGMNNAQHLTLFHLSNVVPDRGLLRSNKAWCPTCFDNMKRSNTTIYEPLLWTLKNNSICRFHQRKLEEVCPNCLKQIPVLARHSRVGYCSKCYTWLGEKNQKPQSAISLEQESTSKLIEELLVCNNAPQKASLISSLNLLVKKESITSAEIARKISVPKTTFWGWLNGTNLPPLTEVIRICNKYGLSITNFYNGVISNGIDPVIYSKRNVKINVDITTKPYSEIKEDLVRIVSDLRTGEVPVRKMAVLVSCNKKTLYDHFPRLCRKQAKKRKWHLKNLKAARIETLKNEVTKAIRENQEAGYLPTVRRVEGHLSRPAVMRERGIKDHYLLTRYQLGLRNSPTLEKNEDKKGNIQIVSNYEC